MSSSTSRQLLPQGATRHSLPPTTTTRATFHHRRVATTAGNQTMPMPNVGVSVIPEEEEVGYGYRDGEEEDERRRERERYNGEGRGRLGGVGGNEGRTITLPVPSPPPSTDDITGGEGNTRGGGGYGADDSPNSLEKVFEKRSSRTRNGTGTGIGRSVVGMGRNTRGGGGGLVGVYALDNEKDYDDSGSGSGSGSGSSGSDQEEDGDERNLYLSSSQLQPPHPDMNQMMTESESAALDLEIGRSAVGAIFNNNNNNNPNNNHNLNPDLNHTNAITFQSHNPNSRRSVATQNQPPVTTVAVGPRSSVSTQHPPTGTGAPAPTRGRGKRRRGAGIISSPKPRGSPAVIPSVPPGPTGGGTRRSLMTLSIADRKTTLGERAAILETLALDVLGVWFRGEGRWEGETRAFVGPRDGWFVSHSLHPSGSAYLDRSNLLAYGTFTKSLKPKDPILLALAWSNRATFLMNLYAAVPDKEVGSGGGGQDEMDEWDEERIDEAIRKYDFVLAALEGFGKMVPAGQWKDPEEGRMRRVLEMWVELKVQVYIFSLYTEEPADLDGLFDDDVAESFKHEDEPKPKKAPERQAKGVYKELAGKWKMKCQAARGSAQQLSQLYPYFPLLRKLTAYVREVCNDAMLGAATEDRKKWPRPKPPNAITEESNSSQGQGELKDDASEIQQQLVLDSAHADHRARSQPQPERFSLQAQASTSQRKITPDLNYPNQSQSQDRTFDYTFSQPDATPSVGTGSFKYERTGVSGTGLDGDEETTTVMGREQESPPRPLGEGQPVGMASPAPSRGITVEGSQESQGEPRDVSDSQLQRESEMRELNGLFVQGIDPFEAQESQDQSQSIPIDSSPQNPQPGDVQTGLRFEDGRLTRERAGLNKGRSILDRQSDAQKIAWESQSPSTQGHPSRQDKGKQRAPGQTPHSPSPDDTQMRNASHDFNNSLIDPTLTGQQQSPAGNVTGGSVAPAPEGAGTDIPVSVGRGFTPHDSPSGYFPNDFPNGLGPDYMEESSQAPVGTGEAFMTNGLVLDNAGPPSSVVAANHHQDQRKGKRRADASVGMDTSDSDLSEMEVGTRRRNRPKKLSRTEKPVRPDSDDGEPSTGARFASATNKYRVERPAHGRIKWAPGGIEEKTLIKALTRYGGFTRPWFEILHRYGKAGTKSQIFHDQNNVSLKDHARSIKNRLIREGLQIPEGLRCITARKGVRELEGRNMKNRARGGGDGDGEGALVALGLVGSSRSGTSGRRTSTSPRLDDRNDIEVENYDV